MKYIKESLKSNYTVNSVVSVLVLLLAFGVIVSTVGYISFTDAFKREYAATTYHMADTAATLVNGDEIDGYLKNGGDSDSYRRTKQYLDAYCQKMDVTMIYVIKVDTSDYGRFVSIFNPLGKNTPYTEWEIGYQRDTTNAEYERNYRALYAGEQEYGTIYRTRNLNGAPPHITTLVPVKNSAVEVVALLCIQRPMEALTASRRPYLITIAFSTLIMMILAAFTATVYIRRQFAAPIRRVINEAQRFAAENRAGEKLGGNISSIYEISALATSIDTMEERMLSYIDHLTAATAEKERIDTELSLAASIQSGSIPSRFPAFPDRKDFDIYASMTPAKEVGGDFYDFFLLDDDHLALVIADVAGKGVPAALFMMVTNILVNERAHMGGSPGEVLSFVNKRVCEHNPAEMFVTVWLGILELSTGKLTASNAGHEAPAVKRGSGDFELIKSRHGLVIGAMENARYKDIEIQLKPGDKLFLFTDGVPEATDGDDRMYGIDRMLETLNRHKDESPRQIIDGIRENVSEFVGTAQPFDDLTALCVELKEGVVDRMLFKADQKQLEQVNDFIGRHLSDAGCSPKVRMQIELAVEEIFVNIALYAYREEQGQVEIVLNLNADVLELTFKDSGVPFNPLIKADPDTTLSADKRAIGGLGIFIVKKNMDDVTYDYIDGFNVLKITKKLK